MYKLYAVNTFRNYLCFLFVIGELYKTNFTLYGIGFERKDKSMKSREAEMGWTQTGAYVLDRANILLYW